MTGDRVSVGVIGAGMIGSLHAENLARHTIGARVSAVMDTQSERVEAIAAAWGAQGYSDAAALIADRSVEAVLIASPDSTHAELTIACIEAGKPVLCEKPMASNLAAAEDVLQAELDAGRRLVQLGFMREYDRTHRELSQLVGGGQIGRALRFRGIHLNPRRADITIDEAITHSIIHDIHSARWLMGAEIEQVYVQWVRQAPQKPQSARYAIVHLTFAKGAIGTLEWSGDSGYGYEVAVEITGESGAAATVSHLSPVLRQSGAISQAVTPNWPQRFALAYRDEAQAWINAIRSGKPTGPSAWDGYMSLVVADACIKSALSGQPQDTLVRQRPLLYES